ncbi:MAG: hypothetical protein WD904_06930 [Dehalococcoidia bacterium]
MIRSAKMMLLATSALLMFPTMMAVGCSADDDESLDLASPSPTSHLSEGSGGGGEPSSDLVEVLDSLPVYPASNLSGGRYPTGGSTGDNLLTGFDVSPGTSVDDVKSFFAKELPQAGWQQESEPSTEAGEKAGVITETVVWTFVKDDLRLAILIPLTHKDAPSGVTTVEIVLAPKNVNLFGSPIATPIDSTPPPAPSSDEKPATGTPAETQVPVATP